MPRRTAAVFLLVLAGLVRLATAQAPILKLDDLGHGAVEIGGDWQFHTGDNPAWAAPAQNDAGWETMRVDEPWGVQSHPSYAGFGWYRRHLHLSPAPGVEPRYLLLMPIVSDAYEVYWNGMPIGKLGDFPPSPSWPSAPASHVFGFPASTDGVLAVRVWKAPLGSSDSGQLGGLIDLPRIGDPDSIEARLAARDYDWLRGNLYIIGLSSLYGLAALAAGIMWLRRRDALLMWFAVFAGYPALVMILFTLRLPISAVFASTLLQPVFAIRNIAIWFLLIYLLRLEDNRRLVQWTRTLAVVTLADGALDGAVGLLNFVVGWNTHPWVQWLDAILTAVTTVAEIYPLIIILLGIRRRLDPTRWAVALTAFLSHMILVAVSSSQQGQRFTHWRFAQVVSRPLFVVRGMPFSAQILADTALFLSVLFAVYRYTKEQRTRQATLEQEMRSAGEIQRVLIPEAIPPLPGFSLTSAYRPAREVGGDFFQIIPLAGSNDGGSVTLVVLGDVSGKGLPAAMSVAMIVGIVRTLADFGSSPAMILEGLNRRLLGRIKDGFATALVLRIDGDGGVILANAGHLPPFVNGQELQVPGSLPLGIAPGVGYEDVRLTLYPGDQLSLYTDGLLEARREDGELYGFERLRALFQERSDAHAAAQAAIDFGQDDDITVLTLNRVAEAQLV